MSAQLSSLPQREHSGACDHLVHFYERDEVLCGEVAIFLANGLRSGAGAILIAKPAHAERIFAEWRRMGLDPAEATARGQFVNLDAAETLARFMVDGHLDARRFDEVVGQLVRRMLDTHDELVAFGEMVSLLWVDERPGAAIELERLWNALASRHRFALYCAYSMAECAHSHLSGAFREVCDAHSNVIPPESFRVARNESEQVLWIAQLQQQAAALANELEARREAEQRLAKRERELSDFVENAAVALHRVGPDGTILWANRAELEMLGYESHEYIGRNIADFHLDQALIARMLVTLGSGITLHDQAAQLRCKDGSIRHVLVTSNALVEDGRVTSTRCFTRDVTDRWLAQEALRERGAMLHLALHGARMGYWIGDLAGGTIRCSAELSELLGEPAATEWSLDAFVGLMHAGDREGFRAALEQSIEARAMLRCEFRACLGSEWRWFEVRGEAVYDNDGEPVRFYGICAEVTARRREQHTLQHLAAVVDSAEDAIISKSLDGNITSWNAAAERIFGYAAEEMIGKPITTLIPPELRCEEDGILAKMRAGERIERFVTRRIARDGSARHVSLTVSPVRDIDGRIIGASKIAREIA